MRCLNGFQTIPDWFHLSIVMNLDIISEQLDSVLEREVKISELYAKIEGLGLLCQKLSIL